MIQKVVKIRVIKYLVLLQTKLLFKIGSKVNFHT